MGRTRERRYSSYRTHYDSPSHYGISAGDEDSLFDDSDDPGRGEPTRRHSKAKSVQFDLDSEPSSRSGRTRRRSKTPERAPNPFAPAPPVFPAPIPRASPYWPAPIETQLPPPPNFSQSGNGNPFNPISQQPPHQGYPYVPGPYPPPASWNGYNFQPHSAPPQRPPSANFLRRNPFISSHNQPLSASHVDDPARYNVIPSRSKSVAHRDPRYPRPQLRHIQPPSRPLRAPSRPPSRLEHDVEQVQRTVSDLLYQQQATDRQEAMRAREQVEAEREAARSREVEFLRREMEQNLRLGLNGLRQEFLQNEMHSEPTNRSDYGMGMYSAPARSVRDERPYWDEINGRQLDSHQQELNQLYEGRRQLEPQNPVANSNTQTGFYNNKAEFDRVSSASSKVDPEHMHRAIRAGVEVALSELDGYAYPPSLNAQRPSSTAYGTRESARQRPQNWHNGIYRSETTVPQSSPFPPPDSQTSQRRRVIQYASAPPQTEAEWVGRPRRHRSAREGVREMNITVQRSGAPARHAAQADSAGPSRSRAEPSIRTVMSGARGPTYEEVRETDVSTLVRRIPADVVGPRRQHPNGYQEPYYEEAEDEEFMSDAESNGSRLRTGQPPPAAPEPPR